MTEPTLREAAQRAASYLEDTGDDGEHPYAAVLAQRLRAALAATPPPLDREALAREAQAIVDTVNGVGPFRDVNGDELDVTDLLAALAPTGDES